MNTSMIIQSQLLSPKFFAPVAPGPSTSPPRLHPLLDESLKYPLTLVAASAGFGKTILLSAWAQSLLASNSLVAWVSLGGEDNDPRLFWTYVLSALDQQQPERFTPLLKHLQSPEVPSLVYILTGLINLVLDSQEHFVLILDDYHLITEQQIHATLSYLVEHLPPHLHIILATRADPPLPLPLQRAGHQVLEIRTEQLRCTIEETEAFFKEAKGTFRGRFFGDALSKRDCKGRRALCRGAGCPRKTSFSCFSRRRRRREEEREALGTPQTPVGRLRPLHPQKTYP